MTIKQKLSGSIYIMFALAFIIMFGSFWLYKELDKVSTETIHKNKSVMLLDDMLTDFISISSSYNSAIVLFMNGEDKDKILAKVDAANKQMDETIMSVRVEGAYSDVISKIEDDRKKINLGIEKIKQGDSYGASEMFTKELQHIFNNKVQEIYDLKNKEIAAIKENKIEAERKVNKILAIYFAVVIGGIGFFASILLNINKTVVNGVKGISTAISEFSKGNLKIDISYKGNDEFGELSSNVLKMSKEISDVVSKMGSASTLVRDVVSSVNDGASKLSDMSNQQSASFEEISSSIQSNANSVTEANKIAANSVKGVEVAKEGMTKVIESITEISKSSEKISHSAQLISEIAEHTNLLALNAAIEAARAGQHGLGFAVVADEVRKLAENSAVAAKEINETISETLVQVEGGVSVSHDAGKKLEAIVSDISKIARELSNIQNITNEQNATMEEESAVSVANAEISNQLKTATVELARQSEILNSVVSQFKL